MKIAVHGKNFPNDRVPVLQEVFTELKKNNAKLFVSEDYDKKLGKAKIDRGEYQVFREGSEIADVDFVISLGGDGTLLETITFVGSRETPILGINTGRLGFLASTPKEKVREAIKALYNNHFKIDKRNLLSLESDQNLFGNLNFALNEFTILKKDTSSMIRVKTFIDGDFLNSYWSDGLIVATPTGSTGYSLSCGGPIILPQSANFIITPVSPHNLNVRPLIVSDNSILSFEIEGRGKNFLVSLDSRSQTIDASVQLAVKRESFRVSLVNLNDYNFLDTLRNKLNWGLDMRN